MRISLQKTELAFIFMHNYADNVHLKWNLEEIITPKIAIPVLTFGLRMMSKYWHINDFDTFFWKTNKPISLVSQTQIQGTEET